MSRVYIGDTAAPPNTKVMQGQRGGRFYETPRTAAGSNPAADSGMEDGGPPASSSATGSGSGSFITSRIGPLPVYAYGIILAGGVLALLYMKRRGGGTGLGTVTSTGASGNGNFGQTSAGGGSGSSSGSGSALPPSSGGGAGGNMPPIKLPPITPPPSPITPPTAPPITPTTPPPPKVIPPSPLPTPGSGNNPPSTPAKTPQTTIDGLGHIWNSATQRWEDVWGNYLLPDGVTWSNGSISPTPPATANSTPTSSFVRPTPMPVTTVAPTPFVDEDGLGHMWDSARQAWVDRWGNWLMPSGKWSNNP